MAANPLTQAILQGLDPGTYRALSDIEQGNALQEVGRDASPTSKWGALGRLANAAAGTYLSNSATSDLAKTIAGGKKSAQDQLLAAIEASSARPIPSAPPAQAAPAPVSAPAPQAAAAPVLSPDAQPIAPAVPAPAGPYDPATFKQQADQLAARVNEPAVPLDPAAPPATAAAPQDGVAAINAAISGGKTPRGIRNNNPLNIEDGPFAKSQPGYAGSDGRFAKFQAPEHGVGAASSLLDSYDTKHGLNTVAGIVNRWAPPSDGNNTMAYAADVASKLGIDPNAPVPKELRPQLIAAMASHENGVPFKVAQAAPQTANDATSAAEAPASAAAARQGGLDVHKLLAVMQNPYADETTKAIVSKLLLKQLTPEEDEYSSSPQGIYSKRTGELKQGSSPDEAVYGGLQGKELLAAVQQKEPGMAARAQSVIEGRVPYPTSSRINSDDNRLKKIVAQIDPTFEAGTSKARMKMQTDLSSSGNSNMGGILSNGKSSFAHLADASDKMADLGNYNGPDVPGGGHVAAAGNFIGNVIAPSSDTKAKQTAINDNLLKYGQEATKFYAGSGGGEAERMNAMKTLNPAFASGKEQAAYLRTEKGLMIDRLTEKERQIRDVMGPEYLEKHPVVTPDLQNQMKRIDDNIAKLDGTAPAKDTSKAPAATSGAPDRSAVEAEMRKRGLLQ